MSTVRLDLSDVDTDPERLEEDFRDLLDELAGLDGAEVERPETEAPSGARSGAGVELGAALIALGSSGATLPMLVALARDWLGRRGSGTIHLKIGSDEVRMDHVPTQTQREVLAPGTWRGTCSPSCAARSRNARRGNGSARCTSSSGCSAASGKPPATPPAKR